MIHNVLRRLLCDLFMRCGLPAVYVQFCLYAAVGALCSIVDVGGFQLLRLLDAPLIPASMTSFTLATLLNYALSRMLVFEGGRYSKNQEILLIFVVSLIGMALNSLLVYIFVVFFLMAGVWAKIAAIPIVMFWNFWGRRMLVFNKTFPPDVR